MTCLGPFLTSTQCKKKGCFRQQKTKTGTTTRFSTEPPPCTRFCINNFLNATSGSYRYVDFLACALIHAVWKQWAFSLFSPSKRSKRHSDSQLGSEIRRCGFFKVAFPLLQPTFSIFSAKRNATNPFSGHPKSTLAFSTGSAKKSGQVGGNAHM